MKKSSNLSLNLFFAAFTMLVTTILILTWERTMRGPVFTWIGAHYHYSAAVRWKLEQRIEDLFISTMVNVVVITVLLRMLNSRRVEPSAGEGFAAEKEEMQWQLFQSSKQAAIGELAAGVAHEINNPLNGIINFAQLLKEDEVARTEVQRMMLDRIIGEGERIAEIMHNLRSFIRSETPTSTQVNLAEILASSLSLFAHQWERDGIEVSVELPVDRPAVRADGSQLRQVMVNLISSAHHSLKAKSSGKRVLRITGRAVSGGGEQKACLEFFDNGRGMDRKTVEKVFDPFFMTKQLDAGTGLGLSQSFRIVRACGGNITVESEEGSHTLFRVELPAVFLRESAKPESLAV